VLTLDSEGLFASQHTTRDMADADGNSSGSEHGIEGDEGVVAGGGGGGGSGGGGGGGGGPSAAAGRGRRRHGRAGMDEPDVLAVQNAATLDVSTLTPLTKEVISRQATINIGTIGHVAHGKSTVCGARMRPSRPPSAVTTTPRHLPARRTARTQVVKAISGVQTIRFKNELVRNITIKLGCVAAAAGGGLCARFGRADFVCCDWDWDMCVRALCLRYARMLVPRVFV
jgi:hypothetical protein